MPETTTEITKIVIVATPRFQFIELWVYNCTSELVASNLRSDITFWTLIDERYYSYVVKNVDHGFLEATPEPDTWFNISGSTVRQV